MDITVHVNPTLSHQVGHGDALEKGFKRHGLKTRVTSEVKAEGGIHVVSGPYYAKNYWMSQKQRNPDTKVILLDRCYYKGDPDHISLGWMIETGDRIFTAGEGKTPAIPEEKDFKHGVIYLADYNGQVDITADYIRYHPRNKTPERSLPLDLLNYGRAIGYNTTALVTAALMGLEVESLNEYHILNQEDWEYLLPWADWSHKEMETGEAWEHLRTCLI